MSFSFWARCKSHKGLWVKQEGAGRDPGISGENITSRAQGASRFVETCSLRMNLRTENSEAFSGCDETGDDCAVRMTKASVFSS